MYGNVFRKAVCALLFVGFAAVNTSAQAGNERFLKVIKKGVLVVGVKADNKPWGFRDSSGNLVGMEPDMARDVAEALGVELELVPVQSSNRMQFLQQGKTDLMIATMSDRADRRKAVGVPDPNYYAAGTNVLAKTGALKTWIDLKGKPLCAKQGAFYNKKVAQTYGAKIVAFVGNAEGKQALREGKCVAWLYDDATIIGELATGNWEGYEMPFVTEDSQPWGLAVPKEERENIWGRFMAGMSYEWHRSGRLLELEKKWGIKQSDFLVQMNKQLQADHSHLN
jgi:polar amino acid transport system substrate-binding protein